MSGRRRRREEETPEEKQLPDDERPITPLRSADALRPNLSEATSPRAPSEAAATPRSHRSRTARVAPAGVGGGGGGGGSEVAAPAQTLGAEILASLPLQALLYYNAQYSLVWACAEAAVLARKLRGLGDVARIFHGVCYALWVACEPFRLYMGLGGNLGERVPHLTAFGLVTLFPQVPVALFFLVTAFSSGSPLPMDAAINVIPLFFLVPELVFCVVAVRRFARSQTASFYMQWQRQRSEESLEL
eukprot:m51a1_g12632 putative transmembrane protein 17 (245) ;mRNA; r:3128-3940